MFQRIFNHTGWGLPPTFPDVTFNPSVMQSDSAILAQAQGSNSRRQCKSQMCVCKSFAGHDHQHRSGRQHGNRAIQPEEGAQFPRHWSPKQPQTVNENQSTQIVPFNGYVGATVSRVFSSACGKQARLIQGFQSADHAGTFSAADETTSTESFLEASQETQVVGVRQEVEKARDAVTSAETNQGSPACEPT